jgi:AcrR family transcriptional regulator
MEARKRRRAPLTREQVLRRALRIADKQGIAALSMRNLAKALGVEAMSLYHHVKNKDDILDGLLEVVVSEIEVPAIGGDWREAMRRRASSAHKVLMAHPWATMLLMSRISMGPAMLRYVDATLGCLRESGFSFPVADYAWNAIDSYIYGYTLHQLNFPVEPTEYATAAAALTPQVDAQAYPYAVGLSAEVIAGRHDGVHSLEFGLELLLDGLERLRLQPPTGRT